MTDLPLIPALSALSPRSALSVLSGLSLPASFILAFLAAASLVGAAAVAADKRRARRGHGRVPEAALLALALAGGWPGELAAMLAVRHKTRKPAFLVPFFAFAAANGVALGWLWASGWLGAA